MPGTYLICCGNAQSDKLAVSVGVAQGSILGPLMFITQMNDLPNVLDFCNITMSADGTALYFLSKRISEIELIKVELGPQTRL